MKSIGSMLIRPELLRVLQERILVQIGGLHQVFRFGRGLSLVING